jgi:FkbM family methyltransferase
VYFSQFGEDRILSRMFKDKQKGSCVEIGANDGLHGSTTLYFERRGWDCVLVEPNPVLCARLRETRSAQVFECAASSESGTAAMQMAEGPGLSHAVSTLCTGEEADRTLREHGVVARPVEVPTRTLDEILRESKLESVDFMSIDVEGFELEVLKGFSLGEWRRTILIVEDNSGLRDSRVRSYLAEHGYRRFLRTGVNDWYAHESHPRVQARGRRARYLLSAAVAAVRMKAMGAKLKAAALPGVLPLARRFKGLFR